MEEPSDAAVLIETGLQTIINNYSVEDREAAEARRTQTRKQGFGAFAATQAEGIASSRDASGTRGQEIALSPRKSAAIDQGMASQSKHSLESILLFVGCSFGVQAPSLCM